MSERRGRGEAVCKFCDPTLSPSGPRRGEAHFAVRFGTADYMLWVFKDGELIKDCYEVDIERGLAWRFASPPRPCACASDIVAYIDTGVFSVRTPNA